MKTHRCKVNLPDFRKTKTGKVKIWRTDNVPTNCCSFDLVLFVWERSTCHNGYDGYSGYVPIDSVTLVDS